MLSPALSQLLERARTRFGLEVEILDAGLQSLYAEGVSDLGQSVQDSPALRRTLSDVMTGGRPQEVRSGDTQYRVYPLRHSVHRRQAAGLLAVRRVPDRLIAQDAEPWSELARAIVEADLGFMDRLGEEQQRSRRHLATLKFLDFLTETPDESALAEALVQAAAVWYDADARVYRRGLSQDFVLHTCLPGVPEDERARRLTAALLDSQPSLRRIGSAAELGASGAGQDTLVLPLSGSTGEWALVLIGTVPGEADDWLNVIARVTAAQLARFAEARDEAVRRRFEDLASRRASAPELIAIGVVHELVRCTGARAASLVVSLGGQSRRIAAVGELSESLETESDDGAERLVRTLPLGAPDHAVLELRGAEGAPLSPDAARTMKTCARVLRTWLSGTLSSLQDATALLEGAVSISDFSRRIQEELERAKRFDLDLALILLDIAAPVGAIAEMQEALRRELRGSDVLGKTGSRQVAALLTHTDGLALDNVVRRLRERLADAAIRLNVSELRLGRAAYSQECGTADALLTAAALTAEPVIVH